MTSDFLAWLPSDLSLGHLQRTWLYWLLVILLASEMIYFQPRSLTFLRNYFTADKRVTGPWGTTTNPSKKVIVATCLTSILMLLTFSALVLASALAFYAALLGLIPAALRFADQIPLANTGETIGAAIGSFIGGGLQILLIIGIVSSVDPTSQFPFRLANHLDQKAPL